MNSIKKTIKSFLNSLTGRKLIRNKLPQNKDVKKILIISLYFTGDLLFHTSVIEAIKLIYPKAKTDIWVKSRSKGVIESNPLINEILLFDNIKTAGYREKTDLDLKGKRAFLKKLRKNKYDIIFDLTGKYSTALFTLFAKPEFSIGINYNYFGFCYDKFIPLNTATESGHLIDKYLSVIKKGLSLSEAEWDSISKTIYPKPYICSAENDKSAINELLREKFGDKDLSFVVLHLTSGWSAKELPVKTFAEVIKYLETSGIKYLIIGDTNDNNRALEISKLINNESIKPERNFVKLSLSQSAELIRRSKLFIGSDSAPLHMAGAFNIPSIGLFGPTNPGFSNPIGANHRVVYHKLHCSAAEDRQYCTRNGGFTCPYYECLDTVTSNEIISLINELYI